MRDLALLACGHYLRLPTDLSLYDWLPCGRCHGDRPLMAAMVRVVYYLPQAVPDDLPVAVPRD